MTESTAILRQEITDLHDRISRLAARLQIDPGGSDRLDALDDAFSRVVATLHQLTERLERLEARLDGETTERR